jgi:NAD(P)-dependent dehydrogenase (short-subunit alcohol dehydrogenase family)
MNTSVHSGKVVLVTGAGSGLGRATALRFADEGAQRIAIVDRVARRLADVAAEIRQRSSVAHEIVAELEDISECRRAVEDAVRDSSGRLDVVISNAGTSTVEPFLDIQDASWQRVIAVNLTASFAIGQSAARAMRSHPVHGICRSRRR